MIDRILAVFDGRHNGTAWNESRVNLVLNGFGLGELYVDPINDDFTDMLRRRLQEADDITLIELTQHLLLSAKVLQQGVDDSSLWTVGMVRVFLSHAAVHKNLVAEVANELRILGLHGFVAHNSIKPSLEWQAEIERALRTTDVLVGLIHPESLNSAWVNQEIGWAYGREIPCYMVRLGADPAGFPERVQWPSLIGTPAGIAGCIGRWVNSLEGFSASIGGRLIAALREAGNYREAGAAARALNEFNDLTAAQFDELDQVYLANTQVHHGVLALRELTPLYERHGRRLPTVEASPRRSASSAARGTT